MILYSTYQEHGTTTEVAEEKAAGMLVYLDTHNLLACQYRMKD